ncbi:hypothetical protein NDU88_005603 [Pleurodeles waltl]|uniref:Uncharacterized protein n=1 Tax=Pleurodeles waltl TaxID=8319 RepID=A0AAV7WV61_PLEWA|nr:hypothetical protein NDU88_005603 [Pleurodeles waltl]
MRPERSGRKARLKRWYESVYRSFGLFVFMLKIIPFCYSFMSQFVHFFHDSFFKYSDGIIDHWREEYRLALKPLEQLK